MAHFTTRISVLARQLSTKSAPMTPPRTPLAPAGMPPSEAAVRVRMLEKIGEAIIGPKAPVCHINDCATAYR
jgi:hypothetical protein